MNNGRWILIKICCFFIVLLTIVQVRSIYYTVRTSDTYRLITDNRITQRTQQEILDKAHTMPNVMPEDLASALQKLFPFIQHVHIERNNPDALIITINPFEPKALLNDKVLLENNSIADKIILCPAALQTLPSLKVDNLDAYALTDLAAFAQSLAAEIYTMYDIHIHGPHAIWLTNKTNNRHVILADLYNPPSLKTVHQAATLQEEACKKEDEKNKTKKNKTMVCIADSRFNNRLIISFDEGR